MAGVGIVLIENFSWEGCGSTARLGAAEFEVEMTGEVV